METKLADAMTYVIEAVFGFIFNMYGGLLIITVLLCTIIYLILHFRFMKKVVSGGYNAK